MAALNQNQFGGSFGGPIVKNKLFIFGTTQWTRIRQGRPTSSTSPPTAAERSGDFSAGSVAIVDPTTNQPFPGKKIPTGRLDPVAQNVLKTIPLPIAE